jgi:hypothetical protein
MIVMDVGRLQMQCCEAGDAALPSQGKHLKTKEGVVLFFVPKLTVRNPSRNLEGGTDNSS